MRARAIRLSNNQSVCVLSHQTFCCEGVWGWLTLRANQPNEMPCCSVEMITSGGEALDWWGQSLPPSPRCTSTSTTTTTTTPFRQRQVTPSQSRWPVTLPEGVKRKKGGKSVPCHLSFKSQNQFKYCASYLEVQFLNVITHNLPLRMLITMVTRCYSWRLVSTVWAQLSKMD